MNKVYVPLRVPREDLSQFIDDASKWGIKGLSITIPHKEEVIQKLTQADGAVRGIGACNTVLFDGDARLGHNTDYRAAMTSLEGQTGIAGDNKPFVGMFALVPGAGGVGRAIAYGLLRRGAKVVLTDGVSRNASELAKRFECRSIEWSNRHAVNPDILVNCTPVGMHPEVDETPYEKHHLRPTMVVFDAVYNPENTLLVKDARSRNCKVITGVDMFVRQACIQFKHFTGEEGPASLMRDVLKRAISAAKH